MAIKSKNKDTFAQEMNQQESEVYETFRSMLDALCEGDTGRLSGIISEDARFADMKGRLVSKAEYLEDVADGSISYTKVRLKDVRIMIADGSSEEAGDDSETDSSENGNLEVIDLDAATCDGATATLTCTAHMKARLSGMSGSFKRHLIAFFRREDGVWRYTGG